MESQYNIPPSTQQQQQQQQLNSIQQQQQNQNYGNFNEQPQKQMRNPRFGDSNPTSLSESLQNMPMFSTFDPFLDTSNTYQTMCRPLLHNNELNDGGLSVSDSSNNNMSAHFQNSQYENPNNYNQLKVFHSTGAPYPVNNSTHKSNQVILPNNNSALPISYQCSQFFEMQQQEQQHQQQVQHIINANNNQADMIQKRASVFMQQQQQQQMHTPNSMMINKPSQSQHLSSMYQQPSSSANQIFHPQTTSLVSASNNELHHTEVKQLSVVVPKETMGFVDFLQKFSSGNEMDSDSLKHCADNQIMDVADSSISSLLNGESSVDTTSSNKAPHITLPTVPSPLYHQASNTNDNVKGRYKNTMHALGKAGLLDITLQTAELINKSSILQKDIDMLEEIVKVTKHLMGETS